MPYEGTMAWQRRKPELRYSIAETLWNLSVIQSTIYGRVTSPIKSLRFGKYHQLVKALQDLYLKKCLFIWKVRVARFYLYNFCLVVDEQRQSQRLLQVQFRFIRDQCDWPSIKKRSDSQRSQRPSRYLQ